MITLSISYTLIWQIKTNPHYKVTKCGKIFNCQRGKMLKRVLNGGSIGYWISGKFTTLAKIRPLLIKIETVGVPF